MSKRVLKVQETDQRKIILNKNVNATKDIQATGMERTAAEPLQAHSRINSSKAHTTLYCCCTEESRHTIFMKNGLPWYELNLHDFIPVTNGQVISPDARKLAITKAIGHEQYEFK